MPNLYEAFGLTFDQADDLVETMNQLMLDIAQA